jgi:alpha-ketoglutarate-dependent taurine dioxygenase
MTAAEQPSKRVVMPAASPRLTVRRLSGRLGAEILGLNLSDPIHPSDLRLIKATLLSHQVIAFRDQILDNEAQIAFLNKFGPVTPDLPEHDHEHPQDWHTEASYAIKPPKIIALQVIEEAHPAPRTRFASTAGAYRDLPDPLRAAADQLWAVHGNHRHQTAHPVVRVHPESGERGLLLGAHTGSLIGLPDHESRGVLSQLQTYVTRQENTLTWHWTPGDLILLDNRITQHHVTADDGGQPKTLHLALIAGDAPLGVNGQHSHAYDIQNARPEPSQAAHRGTGHAAESAA